MYLERFEDMSPTGRLRVIQQTDGDMIVVAIDGEGDMAQIEFCMPMTGGGQSSNTHSALRSLMIAMAKDELERRQTRNFVDGKQTRTISDDDDTLKKLIEHEKQCGIALAEYEQLRKDMDCDR